MTLRYPYVIFDLGNTLVYFEGVWSQVIDDSNLAVTRALRSLGYSLDEQVFPGTFRELVESFYRQPDENFAENPSYEVLRQALSIHGIHQPRPEHLRAALREMYAVSQQHWHIEADTISTLEALRQSGRSLGIISNAADDEDVQKLVDNAGIRSYFDFIIVSAAFGKRKPGPDIFLHALNLWGARPEQAVMVGDTLAADIEGANRLGIASIWIRRRVNTPENQQLLSRIPPRVTIDALSELPALLDRGI